MAEPWDGVAGEIPRWSWTDRVAETDEQVAALGRSFDAEDVDDAPADAAKPSASPHGSVGRPRVFLVGAQAFVDRRSDPVLLAIQREVAHDIRLCMYALCPVDRWILLARLEERDYAAIAQDFQTEDGKPVEPAAVRQRHLRAMDLVRRRLLARIKEAFVWP